MDLLRTVFITALLLISLYIVVYSYLYLRTSQNSLTLVGTHIHPVIHRFVVISMALAMAVSLGSLLLLLQAFFALV